MQKIVTIGQGLFCYNTFFLYLLNSKQIIYFIVLKFSSYLFDYQTVESLRKIISITSKQQYINTSIFSSFWPNSRCPIKLSLALKWISVYFCKIHCGTRPKQRLYMCSHLPLAHFLLGLSLPIFTLTI